MTQRHHHPNFSMLSSLLLLLLIACGSSAGIGNTGATAVPSSAGSSVAAQTSEGSQTAAAPLMQQATNLVSFRKVNDWKSGFTGEVTITNSTGKTIKNWQLSLTLPANIDSVWNATQAGRQGNVYSLIAKDYNNSIAPGQKITFGFNASPGGAAVSATNLKLEWPDDPSGPTPTPSPTTPPPTPDPTPAPTSTPPPTSGTGQVTYKVTSDWNSGFGGQIEIKNNGTQPLENWTIEFNLAAQISSLWNGKILSRSGTVYKVGPADYNTSIPAGGTISIGFNGAPGGGSAQASNFILSGQAVPVPNPDPNPDPTPTTTPTPDPTPNPDPTTTPTPNPTPPSVGFLSTNGSKIVDSSGKTVYLNGLNWFGMETETFAPHGLWTRSMDSMLDQMSSLGYDTLRVPFSNQALRSNSVPNGIDFSKNPDLVGKSAVQILDALVAKAGQRGMRIFLDRHRPDASAQSDLWYTAGVSEEQWISDWEMLARRYKGNPTVIGADLHNEPHGRATWGSGSASTDWRLAAQRAGNRILVANPDWLIIVEGVESVNGQNYWWGGNLRAAGSYPVTLNVPNKVVYSTHDYATSVHNQAWFSAPNYPANLPGIWDANWGYLLKGDIAPVIVGEFGTKYTSSVDQVWLRDLVSYIKTNGASFTYWSWNPNSTDTGGILNDDWNTINTVKQAVINPILGR